MTLPNVKRKIAPQSANDEGAQNRQEAGADAGSVLPMSPRPDCTAAWPSLLITKKTCGCSGNWMSCANRTFGLGRCFLRLA